MRASSIKRLILRKDAGDDRRKAQFGPMEQAKFNNDDLIEGGREDR